MRQEERGDPRDCKPPSSRNEQLPKPITVRFSHISPRRRVQCLQYPGRILRNCQPQRLTPQRTTCHPLKHSQLGCYTRVEDSRGHRNADQGSKLSHKRLEPSSCRKILAWCGELHDHRGDCDSYPDREPSHRLESILLWEVRVHGEHGQQPGGNSTYGCGENHEWSVTQSRDDKGACDRAESAEECELGEHAY